MLNNGYYGWRDGSLDQIVLADGRVTRPDPWQNAGTVAIHYVMAQWYGQAEFEQAVGPQGFVLTYRALFGDPFADEQQLMPGELNSGRDGLALRAREGLGLHRRPTPLLGESSPWGALDFAPPSTITGCISSPEWVVAVADGVVARSDSATVVLDLDGDGDERTGWVVFYFHLDSDGRVGQGREYRAATTWGTLHAKADGRPARMCTLHAATMASGFRPAARSRSRSAIGGRTPPEKSIGTLTRFLRCHQRVHLLHLRKPARASGAGDSLRTGIGRVARR